MALGGLVVIVLLLIVAILAKPITSALGVNPSERDTDALDEFGLPSGPSADHLFGVDELGRDLFARVIYGAQVSLKVALIGTGLSAIIGVTMGMLAGYYRGWVDTLIARMIDVLLSFPVLLLGLGLGTACSSAQGCLDNPFKAGDEGLLQPGLSIVIFIIVLANWPYVARIIRGQVLSLREKEFVEAAKSLGASDLRIIFREILPNLVAPILVYATLFIPANILLEAALSFLGVGVEPGTPSWGDMLSDAAEVFDTQWWSMTFPGLALMITVLAFNLLGDGLQDALNPKRSRA